MHRINFLLDDNAWAALQEIPRGKRSQMVRNAVMKMADLESKIKAANQMDTLRQKLLRVSSTAEIANLVRESRKC
jgi:hypothetical protein